MENFKHGKFPGYCRIIHVRQRPMARHIACISAGNLLISGRIGKNGTTRNKREGDGCSPVGRLAILGGGWRADRRLPPITGLSLRVIRPQDGWCDQTGHRLYNRPVCLPMTTSHEEMWREDHQYDIVLDLDWNRQRRIQGRGSAIFLHLMSDKGTGTAGCVAVPAGRINALLARIGPKTRIVIH